MCGIACAAGALFLALGCAGLWLWAAHSPRPDLLDGVPFSRQVLARDGTLLRLSLTEDGIYRLRARLGELRPELIEATLLYEDRHFYRHPGVNPLALLRAFFATYLGGDRRMGGSTLTMQVARLRFKLRTDTLRGKIGQMLMALRLEAHYGKRDILEAYFNLAPYGNNVEGAQAAARIYFKSPAARLSLSECLALAIAPQNPGRRNPLGNKHGDAHLFAARERMAALWQARAPQHDALPAAGLLTAPLEAYGPTALPFAAPHVTSLLLSRPVAPVPSASAGFCDPSGTLRTTIDPIAQRQLEALVRDMVREQRMIGIRNAAALLVHWPDMHIRALVGSADFHDPAIQGQVDASRARRSPGSTLKPFIYALALDQGLIHPMTLLADAPRSFRGYDPENFDQRFQGPVPARQALVASRNIPAISLAARLRHPDLYAFLQRAGVAFTRDADHYGLSLVLGGAEVSMLELAGLYAMLPNRGLWRPPQLDDAPPPPPERLLSPEAAFITLDMLREGDLRLRTSAADMPLHVKTGTSNGFRDAWAAGVFGPYVLIVWVGNFDNSPNPHLIGREVAVPLFTSIASGLIAREALTPPPTAPEADLHLVRLPVCAATGDLDTTLCPDNTTEAWFIPGVSPIASSGVLRRIRVDKASGLRACTADDSTEEVIHEFWPSDMRRIFRRAGIHKSPPPDWMPGCAPENAADPATRPGPAILSPKEGIVYLLRLADSSRNAVALAAAAPADARTLSWFAGTRYIGQTRPEEELFWVPPPGITTLRVVDDKGRADRISLHVRSVE